MTSRGTPTAEKPPFHDSFSPAGKSITSVKGIKQGKVCYVDVFKLKDLPEIMDQKGWKVSAALMRKWFANPQRAMTKSEKLGNTDCRLYPPNLVDTTTVTMAWALSFPRVRENYKAIFGSKGIFKSTPPEYERPAAKAALVRRLAKAGKFTTGHEPFGNLGDSVLNINEEWQFQFHVVDDNAAYAIAWAKDAINGDPELDDMWGALARFTFKIAAEGFVTPNTRAVDYGMKSRIEVESYTISVPRIGVYARDTYDFQDEQYLGHWSKTAEPYVRVYGASFSVGDKSPAGTCPNDFVCVENESFRKHRLMTSKGGNLLVLSDVLVTTLPRPFMFRVTPDEITAITQGSN